MIDYTLCLLAHLPKKYNFTLKDKLFALAMELIDHACRANQIKIRTLADYRERLRLQNELLATLVVMDQLLQLAVRQKLLTPTQIERWAALCLEVRKMTLGWMKSDQQRQGKINLS